MRKLTIQRRKTFVACAMKLKIYIETFGTGEITINGVPCVKLGTLKNGETKTFEITETAVKVFAIFDNVSKDFCNDCVQLPSGADDIALTGKNKFNPFGGNPFLFDKNSPK